MYIKCLYISRPQHWEFISEKMYQWENNMFHAAYIPEGEMIYNKQISKSGDNKGFVKCSDLKGIIQFRETSSPSPWQIL